MRVAVVTSWADKDAETHGRRFMESFARYWSPIPLMVYTDAVIEAEGDYQTGYPEFLRRYGDRPIHDGSYDRGAAKWARKVFALDHFISYEASKDAGWVVWIDSDVQFTGTPSEEWWWGVLSGESDVSFLGRPWAYASETGFVAYRRHVGDWVPGHMARAYLSGEVFERSNWGDGFAFDCARKEHSMRENDLCAAAGVTGPDLHVWPKTILGDYMTHHKGPKRKRAAYGH